MTDTFDLARIISGINVSTKPTILTSIGHFNNNSLGESMRGIMRVCPDAGQRQIALQALAEMGPPKNISAYLFPMSKQP